MGIIITGKVTMEKDSEKSDFQLRLSKIRFSLKTLKSPIFNQDSEKSDFQSRLWKVRF